MIVIFIYGFNLRIFALQETNKQQTQIIVTKHNYKAMRTSSLLLILTLAFLTQVTNSRRIYEIPLINNRQRIKIDNVKHNDMVDFEPMETLQTHPEEIDNQS